MRHPTFPIPRSKEQILLEMLRECMDNPLPFSATLIQWTATLAPIPDGWLPERMLAFADWIADEAERVDRERKDWEARN